MQAQRVLQTTVTYTQSLQVVQTLLRASFGCIIYLRGLLPDDNFMEAHLTSSKNPSLSQEASQNSDKLIPSDSIRIKTIKRGWSTEGDRLLQYLEEGIFDALEKQHLRSFIFAIYQDDREPENIIEAYTFNLTYYSIPNLDANIEVPVVTLGDNFQKLSLISAAKPDPIVQAIVKGRQPTLGEVKQSVKNLIRSLIAAIQTLNALPKRRFATFKLFYRENTPKDYEPPHFSAGNPINKYYFTTHVPSECPEKISIGTLLTPFHGIRLHVTSIADYIPQGRENDPSPFVDFVDHGQSPREMEQDISPDRQELIEIQRRDALSRKIVWDAEVFASSAKLYHDAEAELDPNSTDLYQDGKPKGILLEDGTMAALVVQMTQNESCTIELSGVTENEPETIKHAISDANTDYTPTMNIEGTQAHNDDALSANSKRNRPVNAPVSNVDYTVRLVDKNVTIFTSCDCGVGEDEDCGACQCEGPCGRWLHVWCMGYHSTQDNRLPSVFLCFTCRLRNDPQIEILDSRKLTTEYISRFKYLSLFRRALKIVEIHHPPDLASFKELLGIEASEARRVWKRLESEGFIGSMSRETDGIGLMQTRIPPTRKAKDSQKAKKVVRRPKYMPIKEAYESDAFNKYFDPTKEGVLLGLSKIKHHETGKLKLKPLDTNCLHNQSSYLGEAGGTYNGILKMDARMKRKEKDSDSEGPNKRVKVSIGGGINLED